MTTRTRAQEVGIPCYLCPGIFGYPKAGDHKGAPIQGDGICFSLRLGASVVEGLGEVVRAERGCSAVEKLE